MRRGRIPAPLPAGLPRRQALARHLRQLKDACALNYEQLSARTGKPGQPGYRGAATLSRAASGHQVPPLATAEAFARAAGNDDEPNTAAQSRAAQVRALHRAAALEALRRVPPRSQAQEQGWVEVRPERIHTPAALARSLRRQRLQAAMPSLTALQNATAAAGHRVPRSRVDRILAGTVIPTTAELTALLAALAVTPPAPAVWLAALERAEQTLHPPEPTQRWRYVCADDDPAMQDRRDREEQDEAIKRRAGVIRPEETYEEYRDRVAAERAGRDWEEVMNERVAQKALNDWYPAQQDPDDPAGEEQRWEHLRGLAAKITRAQRGRPPTEDGTTPAPAPGH